MTKLKQELIQSLNDYYKKISDLNVFYANTADVINDFLESQN